MRKRVVCVLFCCLLTMSGMKGQNPVKQTEARTTLQTQLLDEQISDLMVDHVGAKKALMPIEPVEYLSIEDLEENESWLYPADELYGSWDTLWVNPFRTKGKEIEFPDSFHIDFRAFTLPIDNVVKITSHFGPRRRRMHKGIDLKVYTGDTIRAAFDGKVRVKGFERRGYGYYLVLRHPNGLETVYGHLSKFLVAENDIIKSGTPIGLGGNTGRSTGSHLHFETRFLGQALNPSDIIDFDKGAPHDDHYLVYKNTFDKGNNVYTSTSERIVYHRVKKGETLGHIATKYHTSIAELCRLNGLKRTSTLRIGQTLRCGTTYDRTKKDGDDAARQVGTTMDDQAENTAEKRKIVTATTEPAAQQSLYHEVQPKETLSAIARKYNTTVDALCKMNNIYAASKIRAGQRIYYRLTKTEKQEAGIVSASSQTPTQGQ